MDDNAEFIQAILTAPDKDGASLIYASWLPIARGGRPSKFIRVQCKFARLAHDDDQVSDLQAREYRLLSRHFTAWRDEYMYVKFRPGVHRGTGPL